MAKLENFSGLTKSQEDLLKKHYCFGSLGLLNLNIVNSNLTFHTRIAERADEAPRASAWLQFKNDLFLVKAKRRNDRFSHYKLEITPSKVLENLKLMFDCKLSGQETQVDASLNAEYNHEKFRTKLSYLTNSQALKAQLTAGKAEFGAGLDLKVNLEPFSLGSYTEAVWWEKNSARFVLKHTASDLSLNDFEASYIQKVSEVASIASRVATNWKTHETSIQVGGEYQYDSETLVKGKFGSCGSIGLALTKSLTKNIRASVATEFKAQGLLSHSREGYKFGVRVDFNH